MRRRDRARKEVATGQLQGGVGGRRYAPIFVQVDDANAFIATLEIFQKLATLPGGFTPSSACRFPVRIELVPHRFDSPAHQILFRHVVNRHQHAKRIGTCDQPAASSPSVRDSASFQQRAQTIGGIRRRGAVLLRSFLRSGQQRHQLALSQVGRRPSKGRPFSWRPAKLEQGLACRGKLRAEHGWASNASVENAPSLSLGSTPTKISQVGRM